MSFSKLLPEITDFLRRNKDALYKLDDEQWLMDLVFLTNLTGTMNELNLQGSYKVKKTQRIIDMISSVNIVNYATLFIYFHVLKILWL